MTEKRDLTTDSSWTEERFVLILEVLGQLLSAIEAKDRNKKKEEFEKN